MPISFPTSPANGDTHVIGSITYQYDSTDDKWTGLGVTPADRLVEGSNSLEINASNELIWSGDDIIQSSANKAFKSNSTSSGDYVRMYAGGGTAQWDIYGNAELLRMGDNSGNAAAKVQFDNPTFHRSTSNTTGVAALTAKQEVNNGGYLIFDGKNSSDTTVFSVTHNGRVKVNDGIDFSANANATGMTSEVLGDYEEGSWTPRVNRTSPSGAAANHTRQSGRYTKIGNVVTIWFDIVWDSPPNGAGDYVIDSLPFSATTGVANGVGGFGAPQFRDANGLSTDIRIYGNSSYHGTTLIYLQQYNSSGNTVSAPFNSSGRITGWSQYFV